MLTKLLFCTLPARPSLLCNLFSLDFTDTRVPKPILVHGQANLPVMVTTVAAALVMRAGLAQQPEIGNEEAITGPRDQSTKAYLEWWDSFSSWRADTVQSLNLSVYDNEALQWARTSFIQPQLMIHDKFLYDR